MYTLFCFYCFKCTLLLMSILVYIWLMEKIRVILINFIKHTEYFWKEFLTWKWHICGIMSDRKVKQVVYSTKKSGICYTLVWRNSSKIGHQAVLQLQSSIFQIMYGCNEQSRDFLKEVKLHKNSFSIETFLSNNLKQQKGKVQSHLLRFFCINEHICLSDIIFNLF